MLIPHREAVVVKLPVQIDLTCQDQAYDQLYAAFAADAPVVITDLVQASRLAAVAGPGCHRPVSLDPAL